MLRLHVRFQGLKFAVARAFESVMTFSKLIFLFLRFVAAFESFKFTF
jgi:hypothetical protein